MKYLTENSLGEFLSNFVSKDFIHDKVFVNRKRPDYRSDSLKLIVEFDGFQHYTSSKQIIDDNFKNDLYQSFGYKVIRIPYFIQLDSNVVKQLFDITIEYNQVYQHGFISEKCILPSDFCYLGLKRFKYDYLKFKSTQQQVFQSLVSKCQLFKDSNYVFPTELIKLDYDKKEIIFNF